MDGGAWKAAVHGVAEGRIQLSIFTFTFHLHALEKEMAQGSFREKGKFGKRISLAKQLVWGN